MSDVEIIINALKFYRDYDHYAEEPLFYSIGDQAGEALEAIARMTGVAVADL